MFVVLCDTLYLNTQRGLAGSPLNQPASIRQLALIGIMKDIEFSNPME